MAVPWFGMSWLDILWSAVPCLVMVCHGKSGPGVVWLVGWRLGDCQLNDGWLGDCPWGRLAWRRLARRLLELVVVSLKIVGSEAVGSMLVVLIRYPPSPITSSQTYSSPKCIALPRRSPALILPKLHCRARPPPSIDAYQS